MKSWTTVSAPPWSDDGLDGGLDDVSMAVSIASPVMPAATPSAADARATRSEASDIAEPAATWGRRRNKDFEKIQREVQQTVNH